MEFIKAEEFLGQPVEVQKVLLKWWKPSYGDLYSYITAMDTRENKCILDNYTINYLGFNKNKNLCYVPLLSEGHLRRFIEDKTGFSVSSRFEEYDSPCINDTYYIVLYNKKTHKVEHTHEIETTNLLQTYWKVALEIAKSR